MSFLSCCAMFPQYILKIWWKYVKIPHIRSRFAACGEKCDIAPDLQVMGFENVYVGNDVSFGIRNLLMCTRAPMIIGDHVMFGPNVTIITGNHRTDLVGRLMKSVTNEEKRPCDDEPIVFSGDNWIGANAVILKGVTVGYGSIIASGSIVTSDVIPYAIYGGVPAKLLRMRFDEQQLTEHKRLIKEREKKSEKVS